MIIFFTSLGIIKIFEKINFFRTESYKNNIINNYSKKLKRCFDLENKNQRRIIESLDLIEYCIKEFGID
tara:strand:+ start:270 stop:476 length:207 start_codon:yes stop_codon:yes gene_type:complete